MFLVTFVLLVLLSVPSGVWGCRFLCQATACGSLLNDCLHEREHQKGVGCEFLRALS